MLSKFFKTIEKITPGKWRWVLNHEGFKRYFANTGWMFFGQMFSLLVAFFIGAWIARYLGPENYGVLSYAVAFIGLFLFIADFGSGNIIIRELVKKPENRDNLLGSAFFFRALGATSILLISLISYFFIDFNPLSRLLIAILALGPIFSITHVTGLFFQSTVRGKEIFKSQVFAVSISSLLKIILILSGQGIIWIALIYTLDAAWLGIAYIFAYKKSGLTVTAWKFNKDLIRNIWDNSWPLALSGAAGAILLKVDQIMIGHMMTTDDVGIYAAAVKIVEIFYFVPGLICASLFPAIINARSIDKKIYHQRLRGLFYLLGFLAAAISIVTFVFSEKIITILFGQAFAGSIPVLGIYAWSNIGFFLWVAVSQYFTAENLVKTLLAANILAMVINIVLNIYLIPVYGLSGAAWSTLISYSIVPILFLSGRKIIKKHFG